MPDLSELIARVEGARFALSIRQPWAWLIVNGLKDIENRDWPTRVTGDVLIHAGKAWGPDERETHEEVRAGLNPVDGRELAPPVAFADVPAVPDLGGFVGIARIAGCVAGSDSRWFVGNYGFMIRDAAPLPFVASKGQLGLYAPSTEDRNALLRALAVKEKDRGE